MKKAAAIFTLFFLLCSGVRAMDTPETRRSLQGLNAIYLIVEPVTPEAEKDGLTRKQIQADVEARLREAGIRVYFGDGMPYLAVVLTLYKNPGLDMYAYGLDIHMKQQAVLSRDPELKVVADTWSIAKVGLAGRANLDGLRKVILNALDAFIAAWQSVNPK
jgi:hypothetical protein